WDVVGGGRCWRRAILRPPTTGSAARLPQEPRHPQGRFAALEKKSLRASERDEEGRAAWKEEVAPALEGARILAGGGMAATGRPTRLYGYAPKKERAVGAVPKNHGVPTTLVGALSLAGLEAAMTLPGSLTTLACEAFADEVLGPILRAGDVV